MRIWYDLHFISLEKHIVNDAVVFAAIQYLLENITYTTVKDNYNYIQFDYITNSNRELGLDQ